MSLSHIQLYVIVRLNQGWELHITEDGNRLGEHRYHGRYRFIYPRTIKCMVRDGYLELIDKQYLLTVKGYQDAKKNRRNILLGIY